MAIFDRYNLQIISTIVDDFYRQILASENLRPYFQTVDMDALRMHQTMFISHVMGGPEVYSGQTLSKAHARLNINDQDFFEVANILEQTLRNHGVEPNDVTTIMNLVSRQKNEIVT
jgi:hemoglobin